MTKNRDDVINANDYEVRRALPEEIPILREMIIANHYSKTVGKSYSRVYAMVERSTSRLVGVSWWLPPSMPDAKRLSIDFACDWKRVISLSRLVILPNIKSNGESFLIGRCLRFLKQEKFFQLAVTYADTWQKHEGTIYKATNWTYIGLSYPQSVWVSKETGRTRATRNGSKPTLKADFLRDGYKYLGKFAKHKFIYVLRP